MNILDWKFYTNDRSRNEEYYLEDLVPAVPNVLSQVTPGEERQTFYNMNRIF